MTSTVTLLTQHDCTLREDAKQVLTRVGRDHRLDVQEISLDTPAGKELAVRHSVLSAPGVLLDGKPFGYGRLSERKLRRALAQRTTVDG